MISDHELAHDFAHRLATIIADTVTTDDTGSSVRPLTLGVLADLVGNRSDARMSRSHLYRLARGERTPRYLDIMLLAKVLQVSPHALTIPVVPD